MTPDQKKTAEKVIQVLKDQKGIANDNELEDKIHFEGNMDHIIITKEMEEWGLIEKFGRGNLRLTKFGWEFPSFKTYEKQEKEKTEKEDLIQDLTVRNLKGNIFQMKYSLLFLFLSAFIGFLFSLLLKLLPI